MKLPVNAYVGRSHLTQDLTLLCRATDTINEALGNGNVEFMELDVGSFEKIRSFVKKFRAKNQPLHILLNNAGIHVPGGDAPEASGQRTPEGFEVALQHSHPLVEPRSLP